MNEIKDPKSTDDSEYEEYELDSEAHKVNLADIFKNQAELYAANLKKWGLEIKTIQPFFDDVKVSKDYKLPWTARRDIERMFDGCPFKIKEDLNSFADILEKDLGKIDPQNLDKFAMDLCCNLRMIGNIVESKLNGNNIK